MPTTMAKAARAGAAPLRHDGSLPEEIVVWEILVRLDPKSLLRCRVVRRTWRHATSTRAFLLAHHAHQPALPIALDEEYILTADRLAAAKLHTVAHLDKAFNPEASCDGLLVLSRYNNMTDTIDFSVCNLATRQFAPLQQLHELGLRLLGMYSHQPTGEYRLLLERDSYNETPEDQLGYYVFALGSHQSPRYIGWQESTSQCFSLPVLVCDSLHWYPVYYVSESSYIRLQSESKAIIVFDTIAESFRPMHAPIVSSNSYAFEMDGTLGIYGRNYAKTTIDIWVLQNYESEVWDFKYRIKLPVAEIRGKFEAFDDHWNVEVVSADGDVLLLVNSGRCLSYVDNDGKLIDSFDHGRKYFFLSKYRLKQSLVQHTFFQALESSAVNTSPFI
ncbi:putative F-box protein At1g30920 [Aegilops tauschii subsp. strangulata]|uniref:F-box associated beta-propeller type 3 domain-containing protein n=1 Tax=Aegilops tauschii subsp. strangulata TaxID=200361 RepID=A0A453GJH2_AEGTS|nr:uncharacterized protein LOC109740523 [Aegilops tauschii subsp. strangulata]